MLIDERRTTVIIAPDQNISQQEKRERVRQTGEKNSKDRRATTAQRGGVT